MELLTGFWSYWTHFRPPCTYNTMAIGYVASNCVNISYTIQVFASFFSHYLFLQIQSSSSDFSVSDRWHTMHPSASKYSSAKACLALVYFVEQYVSVSFD